MKNVLHLCESSDTGGAESVLISIVERLDKARFRSTVCLLSGGWLKDQLDARGVETFVIPQPSSFDVGWLLRAHRLLRERSIDVMHSHEFATNFYSTVLSVVTGIPVIATSHGKNYYSDKLRRRLAYRFVARHGRLVAVSHDLKRFMSEQVGIPPEQISVVHNGIDLRRYSFESVPGTVRHELGIDDAQYVLGTVGNLFAVKGQVYLLRAFKQVVDRAPTSVLLIAGDGDQLIPLKQECESLGIAGQVRFLGFRGDVPRLLQAFDVFVLPSLSEGLPLSILEALSLERPVVATAVGGNGEIIESDVSGYLVPPADPESLAKTILRVLGDTALSTRLGKAGRNRVEKAFSLENMVMEYQSLYEKRH